MNKKPFLRAIVFLLCAGAAFSQDFGLTLRSLPVFSNGDNPDGNFEYTGIAVPWFSAPLGAQGALYLSGGISAVYSDEEWKPVPELYRFELAYQFEPGLRFTAGRLSRREPLNLVLNGPFDGFAIDTGLGKTHLSAGAFYSGLVYKKTAYIVMSPGDYAAYADKDNYFASRRLVFSLDWEIPAPFNSGGAFNLGAIGQIDLNKLDDQINGNTRIHSQYALAKYSQPVLNIFNAELGALLGGIIEEDSGAGFCFAASADLAWLPPGALNDRLSLRAALSSGADGGVKAFLPVNTIARGKVLRPNLSGLALAEAEYTTRLHASLSAEIAAVYFFRTDSYTYSDPGLDKDSLSPLLGGEIYSGLNWAPVSDIAFTLGGGVFLPQSGAAFAPDTAPRWRVSLETILSF
jgi:hypothetical protein